MLRCVFIVSLAWFVTLAGYGASDRPNVLFIAVDDLTNAVGCYGDPLAQTPEIDALADRGVTFLRHNVQWPVCGPSRAAMTTSLMPEETGVMGFKPIRAILPDVVTLPQHFRNQGYETAAAGKIHDHRTVGTIADANSSTTGGAETDDVASWSIAYTKTASGYSPTGKPAVDATDQTDDVYVVLPRNSSEGKITTNANNIGA